jgi:hypothetical protein
MEKSSRYQDRAESNLKNTLKKANSARLPADETDDVFRMDEEE